MVHDYQVNGVPEELYNLAQLAEVATVRLQTTNVECQDTADLSRQMSECDKRYQSRDESLLYHTLHTFKHEATRIDMEKPDKIVNFAKKKWKNEWVKSGCYQRADDMRYPLYPSVLYSTLSAPANVVESQQSFHFGADDDSTSNSRRNSIVSTSPPTTTSSSDEDSLYSYSHKIFDRKKIQRGLTKNAQTPASVSNHIGPLTDGSMSDVERKSSTSTSGYISDASGSMLQGDDVHTCPDCGKRYSTSSNLARHRQTHR